MSPVLSIITGTRNRLDSMNRLWRSLQEHTTVPYELIIADASEVTRISYDRNIRIISEKPPKGCSAGYNVAFREARGDFVIWLNDDCEVLPGYDTNAIHFMGANPNIGLGALPYSNKGLPFRTNANSFDGMLYANFGIIRRELGNRIGWFDSECVRHYGCDNSIGFRVLLAGFGIAEIPNARLLHHEHDDAQRQENLKGQQEDANRLRQKYEPLLPQMREVYERCRMVTA